MPGTQKIGAAISGLRIAGGKITDMRFFIPDCSGFQRDKGSQKEFLEGEGGFPKVFRTPHWRVPLGRLGFHFTTLFVWGYWFVKSYLVWSHRKILSELFCGISWALFTISVVIQWWPVVAWQFSYPKQQNMWKIFTSGFSQFIFTSQKFIWELFCEKCCAVFTAHFTENVWGINCEIQGVSTLWPH